MSAPSEMRILEAEIRKNGFKLVRTGNGAHKKVLSKSGQVVTDENGPLILSGSPSEHRWREMHVNRFMKAGVLKRDPWKATGQDGSEEEPDDGRKSKKTPDQEAADERKRIAAQQRGDSLRDRTRQLQERLEPIVAKSGGWSRGGSGVNINDFASIVRHWGSTRGEQWPLDPQNRPLSSAIFRTALVALRTPGATVGEKWLPYLEGFVSYLESESGNPPDPMESALMYLELLREAKGLLPTPGQTPEPVEPEPVVAIGGGTHAMTVLSLEVLYRMARGAGDGDEEREAILRLARRVAELERKDNA